MEPKFPHINYMVNVILMHALVPTKGHEFLINFASAFNPNTPLHVFINAGPNDIVPLKDRLESFSEQFFANERIFFHGTQAQFGGETTYTMWAELIKNMLKKEYPRYGGVSVGKFFGSEKWGNEVASALGCDFIPVDVNRKVVPINGTQIRESILEPKMAKWIMDDFRTQYTQHVILFGQESVGKSTMAELLSNEYSDGQWCDEWARPYLETTKKDVTFETMMKIVDGQMLTERFFHSNSENIINIYDTDILSSYGYLKLMWETDRLGMSEKRWKEFQSSMKSSIRQFFEMQGGKRHYLVLSDEIPFEADPLRVGGDKRETKMDFWIDILDREFGLPYDVIGGVSLMRERFPSAKEAIGNMPWVQHLNEIRYFKRAE